MLLWILIIYLSSKFNPLLTWGRIFDSSRRWNCLTGWHPRAGALGSDTPELFLFCFSRYRDTQSKAWSLKKRV